MSRNLPDLVFHLVFHLKYDLRHFQILVVPCLVGHQFHNLLCVVDHLSLLDLHLRNRLWLAIGTQDKVGERAGSQQSPILNAGKSEAGAAAAGKRAAEAAAGVGTAVAGAGAATVAAAAGGAGGVEN